MSVDADKLEEYLADRTKFNYKKDLINKKSGKIIKTIKIRFMFYLNIWMKKLPFFI